MERAGNSRFLAGATILVMLVVAVFFRSFQISNTPPGLWFDEARNGVDALRVIDSGEMKVFYKGNFGREGLLINLNSIILRFLSTEPSTLRLPAAVAGMLTVLFFFLLVKELVSRAGVNTSLSPLGAALGSSFLLAGSFWHVAQSRLGVRTAFAPLFLVASLYLLLIATRNSTAKTKAVVFGLLAGVAFGLGFHTYLSYRLAPLVLLVFVVFFWRTLSHKFNTFVSFAFGAILAVAPLALHFIQHPKDFYKRMSTLSGAHNLWDSLEMIFFSGSRLIRHTLPDTPLIYGVVSILILLALVYALAKKQSLPLVSFLIIWFLIGLLPGVFAPPGANRLILTVIPLYFLGGLGIASLVELCKTVGVKLFYRRSLVVVILLWITFYNYTLYFNEWPQRSDTKRWFLQPAVELARYVRLLPEDLKIVVARGRRGFTSIAVVRYMNWGRDFKVVTNPCQGGLDRRTICINVSQNSWDVVR